MPDSDALLMQKEESKKPALSATSDKPAPVESTTEDNHQEPVAKGSEGEVDSDSAAAQAKITEKSATSDKDHSSDDPAANAEAGTKPTKGVQKRIDELTRKAGEAERLASEQSKRLDKALEVIERMTGASAEASQDAARKDDPRPTRDQFDDPDAYTEHLSAWSGRQAVKAYQLEQQQAAENASQSEHIQKVQKSWVDGREKAVEKYPDYAEVAENPDIAIAHHVGVAIVNSPQSHDIAYWLGKNPSEAARISALSPLQAAMEIGAIGQRLASEKPAVSKAPAPVKPIGGRNNAGSVTPEEDAGYMERRLEEMRSRKKN